MVEDPTNDNDGDGSFDTMDVDSDSDWIWDCDGIENYVDDTDGDGLVNVWDNDTDNDTLSDVQEMGLDTWHEYADNDRDFDEDGILDGDEYYQVIHQPHTGETDFEASDPTLFDTDGDGMHDGFEVGKTDTIWVHPVYGGTTPETSWWDADGLPNSHPSLYDTDMDGFSDYVEDVDLDGDNDDIGDTEPDPRDDDTDDDGLIDGYEVIYGAPDRDPGTNCLWIDTDDDGLFDGLEWGLLGAMGSDTDPTNPWFGHARYDVMEDGAYTTNPLDDDTDGDNLPDGWAEDDDFDGYRDGNSPYDTDSDWTGGGETDPNVCDTDRGGVDDGTEWMNETDPLLNTVGDWDVDFMAEDEAPGRAVGETLDIGMPDAGILPGDTGWGWAMVVHTDGEYNPDPSDGPSRGGVIPDLYFAATSLHWAGNHPSDTYMPTPDDADWIHYSAVSFDGAVITNFGPGDDYAVEIYVDVPAGALPGWYMGYAQVETERLADNGIDCITEQELADDYIVLRVWVAPQKDIDICDNDGDALGVGLASDPFDFWEDAEYGEMHLMGAPMHPSGIEGMFRVANPNTHPDGDWPYPGHTPDGINDLNGLDALPHSWRDWDMDEPDPQGNVDLTDLEAQFEWGCCVVDPTAAISFDSPLTAGMALATIDSFFVYIDTSTLPMGDYEGVVRVFEDIPHGFDAPNGYWDGDEVYDTFVLKFMLVLPDLDIDDDYANMAGNLLTIDVEPGDVDVMIGDFRVYAAGPATNVDDWDGPGTESIFDLAYYDPETGELTKIPADGSGSVSIYPELPDGSHSIEVLLSGSMGDTLVLNGPSKLYSVAVADVPLDLPAGTYRMDHPESWVDYGGDGTVPIAARGLDTGMGWLDGESGPGIVYDPTIPEVATLMDYFHLVVNVAALIDVEFDELTVWSDTGDPGDVLCNDVTVNNIGNAEANDVHFEASDLSGQAYGGTISSISLPGGITVPLGGSETFELCVTIPPDARADTYVGTVFLLADGDTQFDELTITVVVNCIAEMDVSADAAALQLYDAGDGTAENSRVFTLTNEGNCDLSGINGLVTLDDGFTCTVTVESSVDYGDEVEGLVTVSADQSHPAGTYHGTVTLIADGAATDNFPITVIMPDFAAVAFEASGAEADGVAGESVTIDGITLCNTGNVSIDSGITFGLDDLIGDVTDSEIPGEFAMDPPVLVVGYDDCTEFAITIDVPEGRMGQTFTGTLHVLVDGEPMDDFEISITLRRGEDDIVIYPNPYEVSEQGDEGVRIHIGGAVAADDVEIMIYDMFGGLVVSELPQAARSGDWLWSPLENDDGKAVASGMYIVTIDTGDEMVTRKIMVIR